MTYLLDSISIRSEAQLSSSPNRYMVPINVGDTSESENEDSFIPRVLAPLPSRARGPGVQSPSPLRSLLPMSPAPSSPTPVKFPKVLDEFLGKIEGVKTAITSATVDF
jgi:hypothetical protein